MTRRCAWCRKPLHWWQRQTSVMGDGTSPLTGRWHKSCWPDPSSQEQQT